MANKETLNFSYIGKPGKRLQLFTELKGSMAGSSEYLAGFKLKFLEGSITGYMTSKMKAYGTYAKNVEGGAMRLEFNSEIDFMKKERAGQCKFGLNINVGMM